MRELSSAFLAGSVLFERAVAEPISEEVYSGRAGAGRRVSVRIYVYSLLEAVDSCTHVFLMMSSTEGKYSFQIA